MVLIRVWLSKGGFDQGMVFKENLSSRGFRGSGFQEM